MLDREKLAKILGLLGSDKIGEIMSAAQAADTLIRNANTSWEEVLNQTAVADDARTLYTDNEARTVYTDDMARALLAENKTRALLAENEKLRETVMQLSAENDALREQAAGGLAHRILAGVKQSGQSLLALAIAFDGIAFLSRRLAARHRDSKSRTHRVVVHGLAAAGIALAIGIFAFLSLQDVVMLGRSAVRSRTIASSGQEAPTAAGGLLAESERRGSISGQPSSARTMTPKTMPQPPPEAAVAHVEDSATQPATPAVAALGQTAQAPEAPQPTTSFAPEEEQVTLPGTSDTTSPPPTQSPPNWHLSAAEIVALVTRGDAFLGAGDIASARLFYERAADGGDGNAALRLGATFDPGFLTRTGIRGAPSDRTQASSWYRRALDLGNSAAQEALRDLEQPRIAAPGSPSH